MVANDSYQQALQNGNGRQAPTPPPMPVYSPPPVLPPLQPEQEEDLSFQQILTILRRRWLPMIAVGVAVSAGISIATLNQEPIYEGRFELLVEPITEDQSLSRSLGSQSVPMLGMGQREDYETRIEVLKSDQVVRPILREIQERYPDVTADSFNRNLSINRLRETKILSIRYQDSDPQKAEFILETIARSYINFSLAEQQSGSQQALQFVDEQLPELQQRVNIQQEELQRFRQQYNLIDPQTQGEMVSEKFTSVIQDRQDTQVQLGEVQTLYANLSQQLGLSIDQAVAMAALSEAPRYQSLLNELQKVETELAVESTRFTDNSPTVVALRERQQNLIPLLNQEALSILGSSSANSNLVFPASPNSIRLDLTQKLIEATNELLMLNVRQQALAQAEDQMRQQVQNMAVVIRQYTNLQRELQVATESLNRFLEVREELGIENAKKEQPWQLISDTGVPEKPISPNIPRGLLLAGIAGVLAGVGSAFLAEKLDNTFHSADELKDATGLSLLGTVPFQKVLKEQKKGEAHQPLPMSFGNYRISPFMESFRSLHANLFFVSPDQSLSSIVISSSVPSEGKSTVSVNLARAAAAMGQRVLLVDADLRSPQVHLRLDLPNVWGLSHLISTELDPDDIIQRSPTEENLFILSAGQVPPDPTPLISSKKMQNLVERFKESFDLVIIDTPPLSAFADGKILAAHTNGLVMVVGLGKTDRALLKSVLDGVKMSPAKLLGVVANGAKNHLSGGYYNNYYGSSEKGT